MKNYNYENYLRYEEDMKTILSDPKYNTEDYASLTRNQLIEKFLPLVINLARKFPTSGEAIGVLNIQDLIQFGSIGLINAIDRIEQDKLEESEHPSKTIKSFLSKRIIGSIRRGIDTNRGSMRLPEYVTQKIRRDKGEDEVLIATFFNSIFRSTDATPISDDMPQLQIAAPSDEWNPELLNSFLRSLLKRHLNIKEYLTLSMSFGLEKDGKKYSAKEIAKELGLPGEKAYVRVSQLKKQGINRLINEVDYETIIPFLQQ